MDRAGVWGEKGRAAWEEFTTMVVGHVEADRVCRTGWRVGQGGHGLGGAGSGERGRGRASRRGGFVCLTVLSAVSREGDGIY